ncbi:hypothetical protein BKA67DRAFT_663114 [Truncatella angustata]|uniref:Uncharacterized protein n=1 Tax=Truncatella angustata TaxID=152316 RepID=A0A9P8UBY6_9PEZI|nr:uncharacterized protein BKA67DRAFT_663114 [Truncatella angustata]KAH6646712.1 hypothetical protein BKA67DRAFT_663114 [Truncatella angustata]KAH8194079.1 hypothetical protein TruAng_011760 [Truncatella angustata]
MWVYVCLAALVASALANTEKAIFLGPQAITIPTTHPNLDDLRIVTITPQNWTIRTHVNAQFPSDTASFGKATWLVLDELTEGQRYELRVCWAATQPTAFRINTYDLETVFGTPELVTELSEYAWSQQPTDEDASLPSPDSSRAVATKERDASVLLLQIMAAADYFTTNQTLMNHVPPVFVDIILDPYIFNLLPQSLVPTVGYIVIVAIVSWFLAMRISSWIRDAATASDQARKDQ